MDSAELTLDLSSIYGTPKPISELLKEASMTSGIPQKSSNHHDDYLQKLQHEVAKIDGFKRELPLSMLLVTDVIERLKEERMQSKRRTEGEPVTEELIQLMRDSVGNGRAEQVSSDLCDKKIWMSSAKLWTASTSAKCENYNSREKTGDGSATRTPSQSCNFKNRGGASVSFEGTSSPKVGLVEQGELLLKPVGEIGSINLDFEGNSKHSDSSSVTQQMEKPKTKLKQSHQQQFKQQKKKQRRCWSPELHRRFVDALGRLGGVQTTPKHIKELMQVDSLTNDEVKSHLQKYRIHIRKQPDSLSTASNGYNFPETSVVEQKRD